MILYPNISWLFGRDEKFGNVTLAQNVKVLIWDDK